MLKKLILSIGINTYPSAPLNGCVNDARDWFEYFTSEGYGGDLILDGDATKQNILSALFQAVSNLKYRDTLVVTYSGHGSWVPDRSGDEPDHRDEVWCAHDYQNGGLILDDEIAQIISYRKFGTRVVILSDSCFSGSISRLVLPYVPTVNGQEQMVRFMAPEHFLNDDDYARAIVAQANEVPIRTTPPRSSVLISGCNDLEYSYDAWINNRYNGAFTYYALRALERDPRNVNNWYKQIRESLPNKQYPQTPELTATAYQKYVWGV